jgi:hypothetical protein
MLPDLGRLRQRPPNARDGSIQLRKFDAKYMTLTRSLQPRGKRFDDAPAQLFKVQQLALEFDRFGTHHSERQHCMPP